VLTRPQRQRFGAHELCSHAREHAFVGVRLTHEQQLTDAEAEHRVAQEFEPLIVG
jgi:hypothetical protein